MGLRPYKVGVRVPRLYPMNFSARSSRKEVKIFKMDKRQRVLRNGEPSLILTTKEGRNGRLNSSFALRQRKGDCVEAEGRLYRAIVIVAEGRKGKYP